MDLATNDRPPKCLCRSNHCGRWLVAPSGPGVRTTHDTSLEPMTEVVCQCHRNRSQVEGPSVRLNVVTTSS